MGHKAPRVATIPGRKARKMQQNIYYLVSILFLKDICVWNMRVCVLPAKKQGEGGGTTSRRLDASKKFFIFYKAAYCLLFRF